MKIIIRPTTAEVGDVVADVMLGTMYQDKRVNLSITAGASPKATYEIVTARMAKNPGDFANVHFYSFDNVPLTTDADGLTGRDLREQFFRPACVPEDRIHLMQPDNHAEYMNSIANVGGLDLMVIGLGGDGHFCGNMPGLTDFTATSYLVPIREPMASSPQLLAILGDSDVPDVCVTMGAPALMKTRQLVLIVDGAHKAQAVKQFIESDVDANFPASVLKLHPNFTVVLDEAAASLL